MVTDDPRAHREQSDVQKWLLYQLAHQLDPGYCARLNEILDALEAKDARLSELETELEDLESFDDKRIATLEAALAASRAENAALAKLVDEAIAWHHAHEADDLLDYDWVDRATALRAGQQKGTEG